MNDATPITKFTRIGHSACPHDCPSTCALDVELSETGRVGRLRGSPDNSYTAGVICAKVARYADRLYHPDRLKKPRRRIGGKGEGRWQDVSWDNALDILCEAFTQAEAKDSAASVWPYFYAGTMGLVQRDSIARLRHAKGYSGQFDTICTNMAWTGFTMGTGALRGPDPREMASSDCVVIWGTNPVSTQVNVMTHAIKARKERGAKIVVVDIYDNPSVKQADQKIILRPGTDGALACAVMHVLFRDGLADRDYMAKFADDPEGLERHLTTRSPEWAAGITGLSVEEIEAFARLIGTTKRTFLRLGYGFTRQRNGVVAMHAALSIAVVAGLFQYEGGGAFHSNSDVFQLDKSEIMGAPMRDPSMRELDQSQIGRVLTGDKDALQGGPEVTAMLVQNTNPVNVAPEQRLVRRGLMRDDLFVAVHEQFMTETADLADLVLPATMFLEHDDIYRGGGHQHVVLGPKLVEPDEDVWSNLRLIEALADRLGVSDRPGFGLTAPELIDRLLQTSDRGNLAALKDSRWIDCQPDFETSHYLNGFNWPDGRFRFKPDWTGTMAPNRPPEKMGPLGRFAELPEFPDHSEFLEESDDAHPYRLATSPARSFLNSTFAETEASRKKEQRPTLLIHSEDANREGITAGDIVEIGNERGEVKLHASLASGSKPGVLIAEGLWPNRDHIDGEGINTLTSADAVAPYGGAAFHDNHVWLKRVAGT